ncbi:MAG: cyanophycin synthetase [Minisyncoccia bacterium]
MDKDLSKIKKVFFIGIGGIGISALAKMLIARGIRISGVNDEESPKTLDSLRDAGAKIFYEKDFDNLPEADMYVYSDAWIYRGPEILEKAKATGKPVLSYFEALGQFAKAYKVIAIAGTHGKTTTTAMVAEMMIEAGLDPTVVIGSFVKKWNSNFREGQSEYLVVEADEYNRHFLNFNPFITVVTNIEADHLDCYKDLADIQNAFRQLGEKSENMILDYNKYLNKVPVLSVPGIHNEQNAAAALAVADILKIDSEISKKALAAFTGTWRRLEKRGVTKEGVIIYDDYAHHPTEIRASLQALRSLYPKREKRIVVLFQPHLYSRTKAFFDEFSKSFQEADQTLFLPIYFAREDKDESVSSQKLAEVMTANGGNAQAYENFEQAEEAVRELRLREGDIFVTMGAGEAYKVADEVFPLE